MAGPWARTLRISNLPTVWSNVILGSVLGADTVHIGAIAVMAASGSAAYMGGMALNDVFDVRFDQANATPRPLAMGELRRGQVCAVATVLLAASIGGAIVAAVLASTALLPTLVMAAALCFAIVNYNAVHRRHAVLAAGLMGLCRVALVLTAAVATAGVLHPAVCIGAAAVGLWTAAITLLARGERGGERAAPNWLVLMLIAAAGPIAIGLHATGTVSGPLIGGMLVLTLAWIPAVVRMHRGHPPPAAILWAIAGLGVLDMALLMASGHVLAGAIAMCCGATCLLAQRRVLGT